jgi:HD-GYP domain-containing protein (c-di-GMP phosphodiesterase class II)
MPVPKNPRVTRKLAFTPGELIRDYDVTLEVLSSALAERDQEAKGHAQRVTEIALSTARALGIKDKKLDELRRGALLHDIGNLIVPESILYKRGDLSAEEWVTIHMHPYYAFEMMRSVEFLGSALDIPYCHHEKWDGTGYPQGLKGDEIPLAARIFAVADVWDALTSDRPYRKAWSTQQALDHIRSQSGKHFDPDVVEAFLSVQRA